jgi:hypothetical protein
MATGTGLDAQLGVKDEVTVGTSVVPDHFYNFNSADLAFDPSFIDGSGIQAGRKFKSINQSGLARKSSTGKIEIPVMFTKFGWWWKHLIGSAGVPVIIGAGPAYKQIHTPGGLRGVSFTTQLGKPQAVDGVVKPFTYPGCKITDWDLTIEDNSNTMLSFSVDGWDEDTVTALATASYPTGAQIWSYSHVNAFKIGGTPTTAAGETTIASGVAVNSVVTSMTLSGKNTLAADRYGLGNAGLKKEQLEVDFTSITGTFKGEFNVADWQTAWVGHNTVALQIDSQGPIITGSDRYLLSIIIPAAKITKAPAVVSGPGIVTVDGEFMVYDPDDGSNPAIQIKYVSTDTVR